MRVIRGRAATPEADRELTAELLAEVAERGVPAIRVWAPHRQVAFGRRDSHADGYERAKNAAEERGYPAVERSVGGRAVAYTGETTLAFATAVPVDDLRQGLDRRYEETTTTVLDALRDLGVVARRGEPDESFCPGAHSVQRDGKLAGIAQRVTSGSALVSGCLLVAEREEVVDVLDPVYDALDVPFDRDSVGTVADAGGPDDPEDVARAVERAFVGDDEMDVESVDDRS
ncbi:Lipoate-protein ligase A [Halogranum amylolyticum]|uniref:Lipoate-protein ligase A n=1 Tax=Halogranum amylolyticum TaxID=660520 RepID=A0A1H8TTU8_9EURY|nr:lipoate--protein ligase family protein [Halogranum amylolyticum]SEO94422.1 Lipoate-protein ligase A [Halogranum amylolyticum]